MPWRVATGTLAAALLAVALLPDTGSPTPDAVVVAERPVPAEPVAVVTPRPAELGATSVLALRRAILDGRPLPGPPGGGRTADVPRAGDRGA